MQTTLVCNYLITEHMHNTRALSMSRVCGGGSGQQHFAPSPNPHNAFATEDTLGSTVRYKQCQCHMIDNLLQKVVRGLFELH